MDLSERVLGRTVATHLAERLTTAVLRIGRDTFTRDELARAHCFNYVAAENVSRLLARYVDVADTRDLFQRVSPFDLALPHLGAVSLAVVGAAFELKRVGGDAPLEKWVGKHLNGHGVVTFTTMKREHDRSHRRKRKRSSS